jgi:hypothetical protein
MEKGVAAEKAVLKQDRARIQLLEAIAPPVKVQPVLVRADQAKRLYANGGARRERKAIDEEGNPVL